MFHCDTSDARVTSLISNRRAFTLIELLVVMGIILLLIGILIPVVGKVKIASQRADTQNWINELGSAIERYQQDFRAYPGPLSNNEIDLAATSTTYPTVATNFPGGLTYPATLPPGYDLSTQTSAQAQQKFTMSENLVLGLLGGVRPSTTTPYALVYDPSAVGGGPVSLGLVGLSKRTAAYLDAKQLSWQNTATGKSGHYFDASGAADDTVIPCFVDRFGDPMPVLYMRAKVGANATGVTDLTNGIVTDDFTAVNGRPGQYDISQIVAYTGSYSGTWPSLTRDTATPPGAQSIGVGRSAKTTYTVPWVSGGPYHGLQMKPYTTLAAAPTMQLSSANYSYPYDAYPYFTGSAGIARQKDGYILISAGADRIYGTQDDICNFGNVGE